MVREFSLAQNKSSKSQTNALSSSKKLLSIEMEGSTPIKSQALSLTKESDFKLKLGKKHDIEAIQYTNAVNEVDTTKYQVEIFNPFEDYKPLTKELMDKCLSEYETAYESEMSH
jgi:hypothetical protein